MAHFCCIAIHLRSWYHEIDGCRLPGLSTTSSCSGDAGADARATIAQINSDHVVHSSSIPPRRIQLAALGALHASPLWAGIWNHPLLGVANIIGTNDEPFTDRSYVCSLRGGRVYKPLQLQMALDAPTAVVVDTTGSHVNGYRVVQRAQQVVPGDPVVYAAYANMCHQIASTMGAIVDLCTVLGYNVTNDVLRIVDDVDSTTTKLLRDTLPIVILPYADNSPYSRYAIPGWDGSACMFRLGGRYQVVNWPDMVFAGVNRSARERAAISLLNGKRGVWRNGWYEDENGERWFSDVVTNTQTPLGVMAREFDMLRNQTEKDCNVLSSMCGRIPHIESWGSKLQSTDDMERFTPITTDNGKRFGVFVFDARITRVIKNVYDLDILLSNVSLGLLLTQWMAALVALYNGYQAGGTSCELRAASIGVLSSARSFHWMPVMLLPRLKTNLAVFASIGCTFDGEQLALTQAWFIMYPGIAELLLFVYSILNLLAKLLRRRTSNALFGPTLLFHCALHWFRTELAQSRWLEYDDRIVPKITSSEFERTSVLDFFSSDLLLRLNGNILSLFWVKLAVLGLNLLLLLLSSRAVPTAASVTQTERALGAHVSCCGGLGALTSFKSSISRTTSPLRDAPPTVHSGYELLRFGYLVLGNEYVIAMTDWYVLALLSRRTTSKSTIRVMVFAIDRGDDGVCFIAARKPLICQIHDPRVAKFRFWEISARSFR
ncbi:hypothetical protein FI667_g12118, partial [Globisporangium splendens]